MLGQNGVHWHNVTKRALLSRIPPHKNGTQHKWQLTKKLDPKCESYNKFKYSILKITQLSPWQIISGWAFSCKVSYFCKHHFLWVSYSSVSRGIFVMYHFCKVPLFSNSIKVSLFCWVSFLLGVSVVHGAVLVFLKLCA